MSYIVKVSTPTSDKLAGTLVLDSLDSQELPMYSSVMSLKFASMLGLQVDRKYQIKIDFTGVQSVETRTNGMQDRPRYRYTVVSELGTSFTERLDQLAAERISGVSASNAANPFQRQALVNPFQRSAAPAPVEETPQGHPEASAEAPAMEFDAEETPADEPAVDLTPAQEMPVSPELEVEA